MRLFVFLAVFFVLLPVSLFACSGGCKGGDCGICSGQGNLKFEEPPVTSGNAISTLTLSTLLKSKVPLVLLDCRSGGCLSGKRIPGSKIFNVESKDDELQNLCPSKETLIVVFDGYPKCCARQPIMERLKNLGYLNVLEYPSGIQGWMAAGLETLDASSIPAQNASSSTSVDEKK